MIVVADAGPLIHLGAIGKIDLLPALFGEVLVPGLVRAEVAAGLEDPATFEAPPWMKEIPSSTAGPLFRMLRAELDSGESAAIALAVDRGADLVLIDERMGRAAASRLGLGVRGTLGILLEAKRRHLIDLVAPLLDDLLRSGAWLSPNLVASLLREAGEAAAAQAPVPQK